MIHAILLLGVLSLSDSLSLKEATALLLRYNPLIRAKKTNTLISRLVLGKSVAGLIPSPVISGSYTTRARYPGLVGPTEGGTYWVDFWIEQTIFDPQVLRSVLENRYQRRISDLELELAIIDVLYEMRVAYYDVYRSQEELNVRKVALQRARETLRFVEKRMELGEGVMLDLLRAKLNYQEVLLDSITTAQDFEVKKRKLTAIIGIDTLEFPAVKPPKFPPDTDFANYLISEGKKMIESHPKMQKKFLEKRISHLGFLISTLGFLPSLRYGYYWNYFGTEFPTLSRFREVGIRTRGFYVSLVFNFFDYPFDVGISGLSKKVQSIDIQGMRVKLFLEYDQAVSGYETAKELVRIGELSVETAEEAYKLAKSQYKNGVITIVDLLKSEEDLRNAEINLVISRLNLLSAFDELRKAVGEELR